MPCVRPDEKARTPALIDYNRSSPDAVSDTDGFANDNADASAGSEKAKGSADAGDSDDPGGDLPRTGASVFADLLVAAALLIAGVFALQASRRRTRSDRELD